MIKTVIFTTIIGVWCMVYGQQFNPINPGYQGSQRQHQQVQRASGSCPENNGRYPVPSQCDAYTECRDGVPEQKMCPDGLLFNANSSVFTYPCQYPIDVDCIGRAATQPANPTEDCPHQYGYFRRSSHPAECGQFTNCVEGRGYVFDCPEGLAFSSDTYRCDWPDMVPDCDAEAFLGFSCPHEEINPFFGAQDFKHFRSPTDCQRYFVCVNGKPRLYNCGEGNAYNELILACDGIENVTSCASGPQRSQPFVQPDNNLRYNQKSRF